MKGHYKPYIYWENNSPHYERWAVKEARNTKAKFYVRTIVSAWRLLFCWNNLNRSPCEVLLNNMKLMRKSFKTW